MESKIAAAIGFKYGPVGIVLTNEKPRGALQFKEGRWGCVAAAFTAVAKKRRPAVFDRQTFGCLGGGTGLGFGNQYARFPGGIEYYVSTGNKEFARSPEARNFHTSTPLDEGEGYVISPQAAKKFIDALPITDVPVTYVAFIPLEQVSGEQTPAVIVFLAGADQLSALTVLANYDRGGEVSVVAPFGAGCHTLFIIPYAEAHKDLPRAIIGLTDISARKHVDRELLSFAVPYKMYRQMESNVEGSFLQRDNWIKIRERNRTTSDGE